MSPTNKKSAYFALIFSMIIFGTIGICRRQIPLPSETLACVRGILGSIFLFLTMKVTGKKFRMSMARGSFILLILTGAMIGFNWILLFEAYNYTTVAIATLCYYMQPVIVLLVSPILFKESVTRRKIVCVVVALFGMMLVSGIMSPSDTVQGVGNTKGVLLGLGAAALYAAVVLLNKKIVGVPVYEKTIVQLLSASIALIPYMLLHGTLHPFELESLQLILLIAVGILHTGIAYALYFSSVEHLPVQTAALFSYIDPVTAVLLSALFLHETMTPAGMIGSVMIIGALLFLN